MYGNTEISHSSFNSQIILPSNGMTKFQFEDDGSVPSDVRQAAQEFLKSLDPDAVEFTFQTFDDQKSGDKATGLNRTIHGSLDDVIDELYELNEDGAAICVTVQRTDGKGRKADNIESIRSIYADMDHGVPDDLPLEPSITVMTSDGRYQCYWKSDDMSIENFDQIMTRLVEDFGADSNAKDVARVLRVPGFKNHKRDGFKVQVSAEKKLNSGNIYTEEVLLDAFGSEPDDDAVEPAKPESPPDTADLKDALFHIPADDYHPWIKVGAALHHAYAGSINAFSLWDEWSRKSPKYESDGCASKWDSFRDDHSNPASLGTIYQLAIDNGWQKTAAKIQWPELATTGKPEGQSQQNIAAALEQLDAKLSFDAFDNEHYCQTEGSQPKRLDDKGFRRLWLKIQSLGLKSRKDFTFDVVHNRAEDNTYHPVKDYLSSLKWDGVSRLDTLLIKYCGAEDTTFNRAVGRKFMIAAVRRIKEPGCKFDSMLILEGKQGIGKSTFPRILASDAWFTDCVKLGDDAKVTAEQTRGKWIAEIPEMSGIGKKEMEQIKAALTCQVDESRMAYDRKTSKFPRQFIHLGTTNASQYLNDDSGNRRFWPVNVKQIRFVQLAADRDQLWAEAVHGESQGEELFLTGAVEEEAVRIQESRRLVDPLEKLLKGIVADKSGIIIIEDLYAALGLGGSRTSQRKLRHDKLIDRVMEQEGWKNDRRRKPKDHFDTTGQTDNRRRVFVRNDPDGKHNDVWWRWDWTENELVKN